MKYKTFAKETEAIEFKRQVESEDGIGVIRPLGEKFRVYYKTKETLDLYRRYRISRKTETEGEFLQMERANLHALAIRIKDKVEAALKLQKMIDDESIYNDMETIREAAHIMVEVADVFDSPKQLLDFIDDPSGWDKQMEEFIKDVLDSYDYYGTNEGA
jgi:hypothetical protein